MKLSDAIFEGAKLRPACVKVMFDGVGSCTLGAAYEATFGETLPPNEPVLNRQASYKRLREKHPSLLEHQACPKCPKSAVKPHDFLTTNLEDVIVHLTDYHKWPREKIALWLSEKGI